MLCFQAFLHSTALVSTHIHYLANMSISQTTLRSGSAASEGLRIYNCQIEFVPDNVPASNGWVLMAGDILTYSLPGSLSLCLPPSFLSFSFSFSFFPFFPFLPCPSHTPSLPFLPSLSFLFFSFFLNFLGSYGTVLFLFLCKTILFSR